MSMSSVADFPAKTSAPPESEPASSAAPDPASISSSCESFAQWDRATSSWRTSQRCLLPTEGSLWALFSERWPRAGMMHDGTVYRRPPSAPLTGETACSFLPTPLKHDARKPSIKSQVQSLWVMAKRGELYPTPCASMATRTRPSWEDRWKGKHQVELTTKLASQGHIGELNPQWVEWLMGFPIDWTALPDSEML